MKLFWQNDKDKLLEKYRQALEAYANPANWSNVSCFGTLKARRWKGGGDGADLALEILKEPD